MQLRRRVRELVRAAFAPTVRHRFSAESSPRPIDQVILEMTGRGLTPRVSRNEALAVPGILRGRNMICSISTLPLVQRDREATVVTNPLLAQFDRDVANVVHLAMTVDDLLFESISWWLITEQDPQGFPTKVRHLDVGSVSVEPPDAKQARSTLPAGLDPRGLFVWIDGVQTPASMVIRFDSANPAVLKTCGRTIRRATLLEAAASMYADDPRPMDYFTPAEGADEPDDGEVEGILSKWKSQRKKRGTAWVPRAMKYNSVDAPNPQQLQLVELQRQAALDMANALSVDPEDLGISTTSRTYTNAVDRRRDRVNDVLSVFMLAITQRLSMSDVTRRGHTVEFDLDDYMRANPTERWNTYKTGFELVDGDGKRAISIDEIRTEERMPPAKAEKLPPAPTPPTTDGDGSDAPPAPAGAPRTRQPARSSNTGQPVMRLSADVETHRFVDVPVSTFTVDASRRIIQGVALPYGQVVTKFGFKFRFLPGSIVWNERAPGRVKLLRDHEMGNPVGYALGLRNAGNELRTKWKVARGAKGDEVLSLAEDKVLDGLSVGVDFDFETDVEMDDEGVANVRHAVLREVSITAMPAFDDARVTSVAASQNTSGGTMPCTTCGHQHAPDVACPVAAPMNTAPPAAPGQPSNQAIAAAGVNLNQDQIAVLLSQPGAVQALVNSAAAARATAGQPATPTGGLHLSQEQLQGIIASGQLGVLLGVPQLTPAPAVNATQTSEQRDTVDPTRRTGAVAVSATREALPYRFDRKGNLGRGPQYDFSTDMINGAKGDGEARGRVEQFLKSMAHLFDTSAYAQFDVDKADAASLNPSIQRPDMYVDQKTFTYPVWDVINKGSINDATPFVLPKFSSSSGLVAAHVEGVEPTPGTFVATSQTITPSPVSGKVEITREAWDQGGNPQLSSIIWRQMVRAWFEALEASAIALLDGLTPTGITLTTAAEDDILTGELEQAIAALQFIRGGMRMRELFLQVDLYKRLVDAKDADGRKLIPRLGAVNASGTVSDLFADLDIAGLRGRPSWALAASGAVAASSYLFDRDDVHGWATAPQRLEFEYRVAYVDVAIWGYKATANTDLTGVREIIYDPTA